MFEAPNTVHVWKCEQGCGHITMIDKFYKTRRVFCGVCGTKSTMVYQGEYEFTNYRKEKRKRSLI
ncbi:hypothetical protein [Bacillus phage Nachito]|nr:hypothetical protein [Bacillus phage Nachito]